MESDDVLVIQIFQDVHLAIGSLVSVCTATYSLATSSVLVDDLLLALDALLGYYLDSYIYRRVV